MKRRIWVVIVIVLLAVLFGAYWYEDEVRGYPSPSQEQAIRNSALVGVWKSTDDANFTRTFTADGGVTDSYPGEPTMRGSYAAIDPLKEPAGAFGTATAASLKGMTVIKTTWPPNDNVIYFGVQSVSATELSLIYIGRGNTLTFAKVQ